MAKHFTKALSVGLSLVLCASMVTPAFAAAVAFDKDNHVGTGGELLAHSNEDGTHSYDYYLDNDVTLDKTLVIKEGVDASIDLRGNDLTVNKATNGYNTVIKVEKDAELTVTDKSEDGQGKITGGKGLEAGGGVHVDGGSFTLEGGSISGNEAYKGGAGVQVVNGGTFEMTGGTISENGTTSYASGGVAVSGEGSSFTMSGGTIKDNGVLKTGTLGGGVKVTEEATFTMSDGTIAGNKAEQGGGVHLEGGQFIMSGGTISDNEAMYSGGGVLVDTKAAKMRGEEGHFVMTGGEISMNTANQGGGVASYSAVENDNSTGYTAVEIKGGEVTNNTATTNGGGIYTSHDNISVSGAKITGNTANGNGGGIYAYVSTATLNEGSAIANNRAKTYGDDIYAYQGTLKISKPVEGMTLKADEKPITGWYMDKQGKPGEWYYTELKAGTYNLGSGNNATRSWGWKAAHNEYVTVTYTDGYTEGEDGVYLTTEAVEKGLQQAPEYDGETPTRPGYTFIGWFEPGAEEEYDFSQNVSTKVSGTLTLEARWELIPVVVLPGADEPEIEIDEPAIPLAAGPVTRAQFIDYLWRHEGEPATDGVCTFEDVAEDHEYVLALAWAEQNGVAFAYEDGTFEPDELVTVAAVREFLGNFAGVFGTNAVAAANISSLSGGDDEAVLNCDEVLAEFFGEEYAPVGEDDIEIVA